MKLNILIESYLPSLTKTEQKIAHYIIKNAEKVVYSTLQEISLDAKVGEASILRFCNKIGYDKFSNLKLKLASEIATEKESKSENNIIEYSKNKLIKIVEDSAQILDEKLLYKATELIEKANRIYLFGVGASGLSAKEAEVTFHRIGLNSFAVYDSHFQTIYASNIKSNDLIIAFSISGNTKDIYEALSIAKENYCRIILITNHIKSEITNLADIVLLTAARENILKGGTISGTLSQLYVIDCLKNIYIERHKDEIDKLYLKVAKNIISKKI